MSRKLDKLYTATATGKGHFPWDMLRYDACWPTDSTELGYDPDERCIRLASYRGFTPERLAVVWLDLL